MKKAASILLVLVMAAAMLACLVGCGGSKAEENEVKSNLVENYWVREIGGTYNLVSIYSFNSDGTYEFELSASSPFAESYDEGRYSIDIGSRSIVFYGDEENWKWTYTLYESGMKLFNENAKEFTAVPK